MPKKKNACPVCNKQDEVIPIVYGLPDPILGEKEKQGKVQLGGCVISDSDPQWYCKRDRIEF